MYIPVCTLVDLSQSVYCKYNHLLAVHSHQDDPFFDRFMCALCEPGNCM